MKRQYPWFNLRGGSTTPTNWADNIFGLDHGIEIYEEPPPPAEQSSSTDTFIPPAVDTEDRPPTIYEEQVRMYPGVTEKELTSMTIERSRNDTSAAIGSDGSNFYTTTISVPDDDEEHDEGYMGEDNLGSPSDEEYKDEYVPEEGDVRRFNVGPMVPIKDLKPALPYDGETFKEFNCIIIFIKDARALYGMLVVVIAHKKLEIEFISQYMRSASEHKATEGPYAGYDDLYYLVTTMREYENLPHRKKFYRTDVYWNIEKSIMINDWEYYELNRKYLFRYEPKVNESYFINDVLMEAGSVFDDRFYNYVVGIDKLFAIAKYPEKKIEITTVKKPKGKMQAKKATPAQPAITETESNGEVPTPTPTETTGEEIAKAMEKQDEQPMATTTIETEDD